MATTIELNDAELARIESQRKKKAAEDEVKAAQEKVEDARRIATMKTEIEKFVSHVQTEKTLLSTLYNDLHSMDSRWKIEVAKKERTFKVESRHNGRPELIAKETVVVDSVKLMFWAIGTVVSINAEYDDGEWKYRTDNHSITPYGKYYKTAHKLHEKIFKHFDEIEQKRIMKAKTLSLQDEAVDLLQTMFPETKVTKTYDLTPDYNSRCDRHGHYAQSKERQLVDVEFSNGVKATYTFSKALDVNEVKVTLIGVNYSSVNFTREMILNIVKDFPKK
jgi:hypothetical protein